MDKKEELFNQDNSDRQSEIGQEPAELEIIKEVNSQDLDFEKFSQEEEGPFLIGAKKFGLFVFEIVKVVLISLAIILPVRMFLIQPFYV